MKNSNWLGYRQRHLNSSNNSVTGDWERDLPGPIQLNFTSAMLAAATAWLISNGGSVVNPDGCYRLTRYHRPLNNIVTVTGTNSAWTNTGDLYVGRDGSSNSLVISKRGKCEKYSMALSANTLLQ